jgi:stalled ribosome rescue protein Dom34
LTEYYLEDDLPVIKCLVIAGMSEKKKKLFNMLHPKLKEISHIINCTEKDTIYDLKPMMDDIVEKNGYLDELRELSNFMDMFNKLDERIVYGKKLIEKSLMGGLLEKIFIEDSLWKEMKQNKIQEICNKYNCEIIVVPNQNQLTQEFINMLSGIGGIKWY